MESVRQSCRPKHQVLILKCYPRFQKGVQSVKPNSSELSYLLYYASTRRSKLQKVGLFLEKRTARDVWRGKFGNVQVTLQILAALIEKVPRDLPLYARSVLIVLDTILRSQEISMVEESLPTFEIFCHHQDMATLSTDPDYVMLYRDIVRTYAKLAGVDAATSFKTPPTQPTLLRWKNIGLQAMKSVVGSESLAIDGPNLLRSTMPVILQNLYAGGELLSPLQKQAQTSAKLEREQAHRRHISMATVQSVDATDRDHGAAGSTTADEDREAEVESRVLALRCLENIFTAGSSRAQTHAAMALVLDFFLRQRQHRKQEEKNGGAWATELLEAIVNWTPVQDRFIILLTITEKLIERPLVGGHLESQLLLASLIDWLLCSRMNLVGLSVVDVLIALLQHLLVLLRQGRPPTPEEVQHGASTNEKSGRQEQQVAATSSPTHESNQLLSKILRQELIDLLQKCIGDLATHIYYADQVSDMIRTIVSRLRPSSRSPEEANGESSPRASNTDNSSPRDAYFSFPAARESALKTIMNILVVANLRESYAGTGSDSRSRVPIHVWEGTHWLLRDPERKVRHAYVDALLSWLQLETNQDSLKVAPETPRLSKLGPPRSAGDRDKTALNAASTFLHLLHLTVYEIASEASTTESDIGVLHLLLTTMVKHMGVNAVRYGLPVMMRLQTDYLSDENDYSHNQALQIGSLVHGYLWAVTEHFNLEGTRVGNAILSEISNRKNRGLWLNIIQLPPLQLNSIEPALASTVNLQRSQRPSKDYSAFMAINELVTQIECAYVASFASPPASPPASPGRSSSFAPLTRTTTAVSRSALPSYVKEQMLSFWSKESCLASLESEHSSSVSVARSRAGTGVSGMRNHLNGNGIKAGPGASTNNLRNNNYPEQVNTSTTSFGGGHSVRRPSIAEPPLSPVSSSRESTVKVNELRRVLSVIHPGNNARHLPGQSHDRPELHRTFSSGESLVTDSSAASHIDAPAGSSQNERHSEHGESDTPRQSTALTRNGVHDEAPKHTGRRVSEEIPRVPPLPSFYVVPGAFPASTTGSDSSNSTPRSPNQNERPRTAPSAPSSTSGSSFTVRQSRSHTRQEHGNGDTRGSSPLLGNSGAVNGVEPLSKDATAEAQPQSTGHRRVHARSLGRRADVEKLLEGLPLPSSPSFVVNSSVATPRAEKGPKSANNVKHSLSGLNGLGYSSLRVRSGHRGGIGPPPY
ncbi:hypothetical protein VTO42DRAFT_8667 [Malbranchea cinnamomea]